MKINLNIIKIFIVSLFLSTSTLHAYTWIADVCVGVGCKGCGTGDSGVKGKVEKAAEAIDTRHARLETEIAKKYEDEIINANIKKIHTIQNGITKSVARIKALEHEANMDSKHLIFLLRKNKELYTIPLVGVHE